MRILAWCPFAAVHVHARFRSCGVSHISYTAGPVPETEYTSEESFIPKNTSVVVKKVNAKAQIDALKPVAPKMGYGPPHTARSQPGLGTCPTTH
jgi:hypothetical protein